MQVCVESKIFSIGMISSVYNYINMKVLCTRIIYIFLRQVWGILIFLIRAEIVFT